MHFRYTLASFRAIAAAITVAVATACSVSEKQPIGINDTAQSLENASTAVAERNNDWFNYSELYVDDFGDSLPIDTTYSARIVSLNPTATEILFALEQQGRLVGRSSYDEFPREVTSVPAVGDGIRPNLETVLAAKPTLVILYATGENRNAANALKRAGVRTVAIRVDRIAHFVRLTKILGTVTASEWAATNIVDSVTSTLSSIQRATSAEENVSVAWPLWHSPVMVVGGGSYLNELLNIAGADNVFGSESSPSPQVTIEEIARRAPNVILAGDQSVGRFNEMPAWQAVGAVRLGKVLRVNTELTGRPSVNLGMAAASLARLLHPQLDSAIVRQ